MGELKITGYYMGKRNIALWAVFFTYVTVNAVLLLSVEPGIHLSKGADAGSWYEPALALLKYGSFVVLDSPETLMTYRPPLYPLYEAIMLWVGNGNILSIVVGQIILLWVTGIFAGRIVGLFIPKYQTIALALIVFNPNALAIAHLIQSDTLYALFITLTVWGLLKYMLSNNKLKWSLITSIFLSVSCLVRPTGQYLIFLLPIIFPMVNILYGHKNILKKSIINGIIGLIVSGVVLFPWMSHNEEAGWGYALVTSQIKTIYLRDSVIHAETKDKNVSMDDASDKILKNETKYIDSKGDAWIQMSNKERSEELVSYYGEKIMLYPISTILAGYADSWIDFFGGGGSVNFHNLLSIDVVKAIEKNKTEVYSSRFGAVLDSLTEAPIQAILISITSYLYVIVLRIFGLLGVLELIKRKEHALLLIVVSLITYFAMAALFVGNSRYRLPVEVGFIILALYGVLFVKNFRKQKT
jgi:4-amino-4-deoxy-L-arabinose transferase-like glycosyltransferase